MKRGRPKGRCQDRRSFGPLGDLIRSNRIKKGLGLIDVAKACDCSVQFVSNIEHGRAPLPWDKLPSLASLLKIPMEDLQAANLAIRSDFQSFVGGAGKLVKAAKQLKNGKTAQAPLQDRLADAATAMAIAAKDSQLRDVIQRYQSATPEQRKKFVRTAIQMLAN